VRRPTGVEPDGSVAYVPESAFKDAALAAKATATTGFPWMLLGAGSWGELRSFWLGEYVLSCVERVGALQAWGHEFVRDGGEAFEANLRDWVRLFVKNEPHGESKVLSNRWRLIFNTGATDIGVWRWLFRPLMQHFVDNCDTSPFKPGMGLHDEGLRALKVWFNLVGP
jgi:hypothetical protein